VTGRFEVMAVIAAFAVLGTPRCHGQSVLRIIDDPAAGEQWLLMRDANHPGGPGRMVQVATRAPESAPGSLNAARQPAGRAQGSSPATIQPAIHSGEALIVEQHTAIIDARLEATAMGSAAVGAEFPARLKIGGKIIRAVARAAGKAELVQEPAVQR